MYLDQYAFNGIGSQQGQRKLGLSESAELALKLMPKHWAMADQHLLFESGAQRASIGPQAGGSGPHAGGSFAGFHPLIHSHHDLAKLDWSIYDASYQLMRSQLSKGIIPINWGGDHSVGMSTVAAFTSMYSNGSVLWIDAHADLNTPESSPTGNFHGMPLSILLGIGQKPKEPQAIDRYWGVLKPNRLIYFGLRDLDPYEKYLIQSQGIPAYFADEIRHQSIDSILREMRTLFSNRPVHISFDIDSVDPSLAPSTGVKCEQGLNLFHLGLLCDELRRLRSIKSVDVVEVNPQLGEANQVIQTYNVAFSFLKNTLNMEGGFLYDTTAAANKNQVQIPQTRHQSLSAESYFSD